VLSYRILLYFIASFLLLTAAPDYSAQDVVVAPESRPAPSPTPTPAEREGQDSVKVFTEEVRLPILVTDDKGRFDPTLEAADILVLEDDVPQEVRSVRHMPASLLLLLDTSGGINPAMKTTTTRAIALSLVSKLKQGDLVSVLQAGDRVELLQPWTTDAEALTRALRTRLSSGGGRVERSALWESPSCAGHRRSGSDRWGGPGRSYQTVVRCAGHRACDQLHGDWARGNGAIEFKSEVRQYKSKDSRRRGERSRPVDPDTVARPHQRDD
jgi:hypothetical protein